MSSESPLARFLKKWGAPIVGVTLAVLWFLRSLSLPEAIRGLKCCDAAEYISHASESQLWNHTGRRAFGYSLFLGLFQQFARWRGTFRFDSFSWITPALYVQLIVWLATCFILFFAIRRGDKHYRYAFLGILLAHPAFSAYSALTLTETLSTSLFCVGMACVLQLSFAKRFFWVWSFLAALTLGYATAMRPNFLAVFALTAVAVGAIPIWRGIKEGWPLRRAMLVALTAWIMVALGTIPTVGKAVQNCTRDYHRICIVDPTTERFATDQSLWLGLTQIRVWSSLQTGLRGTEETLLGRFASRCHLKLGSIKEAVNPYVWLLECYKSFPVMVPAVLFKKLVAGFDHHHLSCYAADTTTRFEYYLNKTISLGSFLGFFFALFVCMRALWNGSLYKVMHLVLPICFVLVQINFHIEARYFFPTFPIFLLTFLYGISKVATFRIIPQLTVVALCALLVTTSVVMSHEWYLRDCVYLHDRIPFESRSEGLMTDCPPLDEVKQELKVYEQRAPEWPLSW